MNTSVKNIERWLKRLKDDGKIEFRGAPKTNGTPQKLLDISKMKDMSWNAKIKLKKGIEQVYAATH